MFCMHVHTFGDICMYKSKYNLNYLKIGVAQLCHVLFDDESMDGIITLLHHHKLVTVEDAEMFQYFAYNKYFQKQFLLWCLHNLRLPVWLVICDVLQKEKSMEHTGNQLLQGELCIQKLLCYCIICIRI